MNQLNEAQFLGYLILAFITLGGFIGIVNKMSQPVNELKIVIQELKDCIATLKADAESHNYRITQHGEEIDELDRRLTRVETELKLRNK